MKYLLTLIAATIAAFGLSAQNATYELIQTESTIQIFGTSSFYDWDEDVTKFSAEASSSSDSFNISIIAAVEFIESEEPNMDTKTYAALKYEQHPYINLKAENLEISATEIYGEGSLEVAGVKKIVPVNARIFKNGKKLIATGTLYVLMSDFEIEPPTAFFGKLTTGNQVKIAYKITLLEK